MITEIDIDKALQCHMRIIVDGVLKKMSEPPLAIYLVGGYGRGEGAWFEDETGLHPYNDYDIAVLSDNPLRQDEVDTLRKELAEAVNISWVDIDFYSTSQIGKLKPTIHNYDLLYGSTLIYGEDYYKINELALDGERIGNSDILLLYRTRLWTFLGSWEGRFHDLSIVESRFFRNQMAKAVLAACDMRLVKLGKYTASYKKRVGIVLSEFNALGRFCELAEWALKEKLRPSSIVMSYEEMQTLYFDVKEVFLNSFQFSYPLAYPYFVNPYKTKQFYLLHTKHYLYRLYYTLKTGHYIFNRGLNIFYAMNFVFAANN